MDDKIWFLLLINFLNEIKSSFLEEDDLFFNKKFLILIDLKNIKFI
tara:strand:+ start:274 stop:411 length:138 start_codon:yes stop_codon:yes gene_type:complete